MNNLFEEITLEEIEANRTRIFRDGGGNITSEYFFFLAFLPQVLHKQFETEIDEAEKTANRGCISWMFYLDYRRPGYFAAGGKFFQYLHVLLDILNILHDHPNYSDWLDKRRVETMIRRSKEVIQFRKSIPGAAVTTQGSCLDYHDTALALWRDILKYSEALYKEIE